MAKRAPRASGGWPAAPAPALGGRPRVRVRGRRSGVRKTLSNSLGKRQPWANDSHGPTTVVVQRQSWSNGSLGQTTAVVQRQSWANDSHGPTTVMVERQPWSNDSHGHPPNPKLHPFPL